MIGKILFAASVVICLYLHSTQCSTDVFEHEINVEYNMSEYKGNTECNFAPNNIDASTELYTKNYTFGQRIEGMCGNFFQSRNEFKENFILSTSFNRRSRVVQCLGVQKVSIAY